MKHRLLKNFRQYLPFIILALSLFTCLLAFGDVGNQNRYTSGDSGIGGDGDWGMIIGYLIGLFIENPVMGMIVLAFLIIVVLIRKRKAKKQSTNTGYINQQVNQQANAEVTVDYSSSVAAQIQAIDPAFSADKFIGFAREVFMTIQAAWTAKDWQPIRPFESEALFNTHKQQIDEYIRLGKTNVIEKIGIKHCSLHSFQQDGDKEVLVVWLNAVMRDYVIEDATKKVLESDPNRDWFMKYEMVFNRKAGVKTDPGKNGLSSTNCPYCGAPTEITSAGKCPFCGSVLVNGEHDWVLTDIRSRS